jgi:hypothetical protein
MKRYANLLLAPAALLFQALPGLFLYLGPILAFSENPALQESQVWALSMACLVLFALLGLALACAASYLLLTRSRRLVAVALIIVCCVPAWLLSVFYLQGVLVFLAWV